MIENEKSSVTSRVKVLTWYNIHCLPSPEILHVNRQSIYNILNSRPFLPLNRSRQFLSNIYSGQNDITFNSIVLSFPHGIQISIFFLWITRKLLIIHTQKRHWGKRSWIRFINMNPFLKTSKLHIILYRDQICHNIWSGKD